LEIKKIASKNGLEVILEFGNPNDIYSMDAKSLSNVASTSKSREDFTAKLLALVEEYQFNGLCLRWESPGCLQVSYLNIIVVKTLTRKSRIFILYHNEYHLERQLLHLNIIVLFDRWAIHNPA
jgi:hypothetical protein